MNKEKKSASDNLKLSWRFNRRDLHLRNRKLMIDVSGRGERQKSEGEKQKSEGRSAFSNRILYFIC